MESKARVQLGVGECISGAAIVMKQTPVASSVKKIATESIKLEMCG
jgi:hypothetical protein